MSVLDAGCAKIIKTWFVTSRKLGFGGKTSMSTNGKSKVLWVINKNINNILGTTLICNRYVCAGIKDRVVTSGEFRKGSRSGIISVKS